MDDDQKIIYDLLTEVRNDQKKDSKRIQKTETCVSNMQGELAEVKRETKLNTKHMGEHMNRTALTEESNRLLRELHQDNQKRIEALEDSDKKKAEEISSLKEAKQVDEKVKHWFKDNLKYWLAITSLTVGLITKAIGLW